MIMTAQIELKKAKEEARYDFGNDARDQYDRDALRRIVCEGGCASMRHG